MLKAFMCGLVAITFSSAAAGKEVPAEKGRLLIEEKFDAAEVSAKVFKGGIGEWKVANGVVHGTELAKDNHPAAGRLSCETRDAIFEFRFRITENGESFNCGFDPAKGELDKKGHLWSVSISGGKWRLAKAPDKNKPKEDPAKTLDQGEISVKKGEWYTMRIVSRGNKVSVAVGDSVLSAEHSSFHVKKPSLIFRCKGDGIEVDDIRIWEVKE